VGATLGRAEKGPRAHPLEGTLAHGGTTKDATRDPHERPSKGFTARCLAAENGVQAPSSAPYQVGYY
jgi:hypothetical protein